MNVAKLRKELKRLKIPERHYSILEGDLDEAYCLMFDECNKTWEIYYSERGHKNEIGIYESERAACEAFLNEVKQY